MAGIGIVNNPRSRRNLRQPETATRLRRLLDGDGEVADASTPDELASVVERFRRAGIEVLGVNGGDGTGHKVLTAFASAYGSAPLPRLALLRGGAMNNVATSHGIRGPPERTLRRLVEHARAGRPYRTVERDLLRIEADGGVPLYGFLFGTGVVVTFLDAYYRSPRPSRARAAALVVRGALSSLVGGSFARSLARREPLRVRADGEEWPDAAYAALLAGTVPEMGLGFEPLARCSEQPGFFHAVGITASIARIVPRLPGIWLGRPWPRRLAMDAVTRDLAVQAPSALRFTLDGDLYAAGRSLRISTGPSIAVIVGLGA